MKPYAHVFCFAFLGGAALCPLLLAQQETGSIAGQVSDLSGAVIPNAQLIIQNRATGARFEPITDAAGFYRAPQLGPGTYDITVTAAGFSTLVREGIEVRVADRLRVDFVLQVGALTEKIVVRGDPPLLQTEDAAVGQVIDNQRITELPLNGRNWLQLATLAPATVTYGFAPGGDNPQSLGGTPTNQTNYLLNGLDDTNYIGGGGQLASPPVDSIQEFKVQTNNYTADTGRLGGAVVNATIKSGSSTYHGTAYEFLRNRKLNARNFFSVPTQGKPQFTRNQFGASIGGPMLPKLKEKLLFFLNYEGNRQRQDAVVSRQVFTDQQKAGDFAAQLGAQIGLDPLGRPVAAGQVFDPFSVRRLESGAAVRDAFPGNIIPASRINPVSRTLINLVPGPNATGTPNFIRNLGAPFDADTFVGRVDWLQSNKDTVWGHLIYTDSDSFTAPILGLPADGGNTINSVTSNQRQAGLGWTHVFSPTDLNEFRLGYVRNVGLRESVQSSEDLNAKYGIPFAFAGPNVGGLAAIQITGFTAIGTSERSPFFQFINKYELTDSYTAIRGPHALKFGVRGALKLFQNQKACSQCRGLLKFNGVFTRQVGFSKSGSPVADFLTGAVNSSTLGNVANEKDVGREIEWYAQDKWQVKRNLTITLGVRYQYNPPSWEARDLISNVVWDKGYVNPQVVVPKGQDEATFQFMKNELFPFIPVRRAPELDRGLVRNANRNFAPRLGIAYQITPKIVLRMGYGVFYGFPDVVSGAVLTTNPPAKFRVTTASNTIDPTLLIDQSIFGPDPFNSPQTNGKFKTRNPHFPPAFTQMYNMSVQYEFAPAWVLEVGFLGNRSSRLALVRPINDARPAPPNDTSSPQSRRIVSDVLGNLSLLTPEGFSNYNALTLNLEKRFSQGLSILANYTWSRALGVAPAILPGINDAAIQNPLDLAREYGPLEFDVINRGSISFIYDLPFGNGKRYGNGLSGPLNQILGGWQINGITTFQGGFPITPGLGFSLGKTFTNSRPNAVGDPKKTTRQPHDWFSPAAFTAPSGAEIAAGNFFGNAGRGSIREPRLANLDLSVNKVFPIHEKMRLQFRAEIFNFTNTPFFGLPGAVGTTFGSPSFGKVTRAGDPRVVQFGLKLIF